MRSRQVPLYEVEVPDKDDPDGPPETFRNADALRESVVYALNRIDDSQAQRIALAVFREHIPQVRWFRNAGGVIDAEMV